MELGGRRWRCIGSTIANGALVEEWCPRDELPTRASLLLSRTRWAGPLVAPPLSFVEQTIQLTTAGTFVRPAVNVFRADERVALWVTAFADVLLGDYWRLQLVTNGAELSGSCTIEVQGTLPAKLDNALIDLIGELHAAPVGELDPLDTPGEDEIHAALSAVQPITSPEQLAPRLGAIDELAKAIEALPPTFDADMIMADLAGRLLQLPGADFLGLTNEALRLFRVLLRRTDRASQGVAYALYMRGALLALRQLIPRSKIQVLIAVCRRALDSSSLSTSERAILYHDEAELLLLEGTPESLEAAVKACRRSVAAARRMGSSNNSFVWQALESLAQAHRRLGSFSREAAALEAAIPLCDDADERARLEARLRELRTGDTRQGKDRWGRLTDWFQKHQADVGAQTTDRLIFASPMRRPGHEAPSIVLLRPLVTTRVASLPNGFENPLVHAWRFAVEPTNMTLEETLSRALGHAFSFSAVGGEYEAYGVGRIGGMPEEELRDPERWKAFVNMLVSDTVLASVLLVVPSDSAGMNWELDLLATRPCPDQLRLFLVPPNVDSAAAEAAWERARIALAAHDLAVPKQHTAGLVFEYSNDGSLAWSDTFDVIWNGSLARWIDDRESMPSGPSSPSR